MAREVVANLRQNLILSLGIGLIAGFLACKTVAFDWRSNVIFSVVIGLIGLFLSQLVLLSFAKPYLELLPQFRLLFDLIAAYLAAFVLAAIIHFIKPV